MKDVIANIKFADNDDINITDKKIVDDRNGIPLVIINKDTTDLLQKSTFKALTSSDSDMASYHNGIADTEVPNTGLVTIPTNTFGTILLPNETLTSPSGLITIEDWEASTNAPANTLVFAYPATKAIKINSIKNMNFAVNIAIRGATGTAGGQARTLILNVLRKNGTIVGNTIIGSSSTPVLATSGKFGGTISFNSLGVNDSLYLDGFIIVVKCVEATLTIQSVDITITAMANTATALDDTLEGSVGANRLNIKPTK